MRSARFYCLQEIKKYALVISKDRTSMYGCLNRVSGRDANSRSQFLTTSIKSVFINSVSFLPFAL
jgi:hypothetical protein